MFFRKQKIVSTLCGAIT
ncbi:putative cross-wall-targeting lipoprotein signal domain-containing proteiin [Gloeocapsopsis sp. IPPAS B-1203]